MPRAQLPINVSDIDAQAARDPTGSAREDRSLLERIETP
jgi:hypothetical protein